MFPFNNHHKGRQASTGRHARLGHGRSRRLRVEAMESRLMLAGTTIEFAPLDLEAAQIGLSDLRSYLLDPNQTVFVATLAEGGFVADQVNYLTANAFDGDSVVAFDRPVVNSQYLNSFVTLGTSITRSTFNVADKIADSSSDWQLFDVTGVLNDGMTLRLISAPSDQVSSTAAADLQPILSEFASIRSQESGVDQGGLIPIQPILEIPSGGPRNIEKVAQSERRESSRDVAHAGSFVAAVPATTRDRAISGEWARAMVFETAGGEPERNIRVGAGDKVELRPLSTGAADAPAGQSLSLNRSHRAGGAGESVGAASGLEEVRWSLDPWDQRNENLAGGLDVGSTGWRAVTNSDTAEFSGELTFANGSAGTFADPDLARAAVFDEIGGDPTQVNQSITHGIVRGSLGATPLLMVLALERIAASNSRRSKREADPAVGARSRWRLPARGGPADE